jgi:hypothetical protein
MIHQSTLSFNGGEITPYLAHLTNLAKHSSSSARMENFLPMPFGGFRKRPGTYHLATLPAAARLEAFTFSDGSNYVLAFLTDRIIVFQPDGTQDDELLHTLGDPFKIQFSQINDIIHLVSPNFHPLDLSFPIAGWDLSLAEFAYPPMLDENFDETLTLDVPGTGSVAPGASFTLTASAALFDANHVGAYFEIARKRLPAAFEVTLQAATGTSPTLEVSGVVYFSTISQSGGWTGTFTVQKSIDGGTTWTDVRAFYADHDRNIPVTEIDEGDDFILMRIKYLQVTGSDTNSRGILEAKDGFIRGLCKVTVRTSSTIVTAEAVTRVPVTTSEYWTEGAFSAYQGFPKAIAIHDRRRIYGGTARRPMSVWASATDDLDNFRQGTESDEGFYRTLAATRQSPIQWLASQRRLFIGTEQGEWVVGSDSDSLISPESFLAREYTRYGSNSVPAIPVNDSIYFVERQGRRLRELAYVLERETFDAADLTRLAEHIAVSGITQAAFQHSREPMLWCTTGGGDLLSFAYNRSEQLAAWSRHSTEIGTFTSVAVLRTDDGDDSVFLVTKRLEDGEITPEYHLEVFAAGQQKFQEDGDLDNIHLVDAGVYGATSGVDNELAVPAHLEGQTLNVLADGVFLTADVLAGVIKLNNPATHVHAGLPITSTLESLPQDIPVNNGTTHARMKRASELKLNVFATFGGSYTYDAETNVINYTNTDDLLDSAPPLKTGWIEETLTPAHLKDLSFSVVHDEPYPFTCRACVLSWTLHEP